MEVVSIAIVLRAAPHGWGRKGNDPSDAGRSKVEGETAVTRTLDPA
jgi:hypothetical protein